MTFATVSTEENKGGITDIPVTDAPTRFQFGQKFEQINIDPFFRLKFSTKLSSSSSEYHPRPIDTVYYEAEDDDTFDIHALKEVAEPEMV